MQQNLLKIDLLPVAQNPFLFMANELERSIPRRPAQEQEGLRQMVNWLRYIGPRFDVTLTDPIYLIAIARLACDAKLRDIVKQVIAKLEQILAQAEAEAAQQAGAATG